MNQLQKKTKIRNINIPRNSRLIFVSDIHGDVDTFKEGLKQIQFCRDDYLFIIGDIYEKGDFHKNLETIQYVLKLSDENSNVYPMAGNCDEVLRFILPRDQKDKFLYYANVKKHSIINDMAQEMNFKVSMDMDVEQFISLIQVKYKELYDFVDRLDDVIFINDELVLVHGGIDDIHHISPNSLDLLKYDNFYEISKNQEKLMIVGHNPTRNYRSDITCVNPIFDFKKNIISIDGGNHIVKGGQINFVYLESLETMKFGFSYVDHYPKHVMKETVNYVKPSQVVNIKYGENEIEILDTDLDFYFIKHISTNTCMWVHNSFVYKNAKTNKTYCYDGSNQFISATKGEQISIIKKAMPYSLVKKDGYIGLMETKYLEDDF